MASILTLEPKRRDEIVSQAIQGRNPVVLTVRQADGWTTLKSNFLAHQRGGNHIALVLSVPGGDRETPLRPGEQVGVSFRRGHKKCMFATTVQGTVDAAADAGTSDVVVLRWPETLQELQRRVYHRACPPPGRTLRVDVWPGHADEPAPTRPAAPPKVSGIIEDLSVGGMRAACDEEGGFHVGDPARCAFAARPNSEPFVLNAVFRHVEPKGSRFSHGFQFVGIEVRPDGHQVLSRLARVVTNFQRATTRHTTRNRPRSL